MTFNYSKERIGHCEEFDQDVVSKGDTLVEHVDRCDRFEAGKPKHDK